MIFDWVCDNVEYCFDEWIKICLDVLNDGYGDCEEFFFLFIVICWVRGIFVCVVWIFGYIYFEFYFEDS